jgi:hypothetical protein
VGPEVNPVIICAVLEAAPSDALSRRKREAVRLTGSLADALLFEVRGLSTRLFLTWLGVQVAF